MADLENITNKSVLDKISPTIKGLSHIDVISGGSATMLIGLGGVYLANKAENPEFINCLAYFGVGGMFSTALSYLSNEIRNRHHTY